MTSESETRVVDSAPHDAGANESGANNKAITILSLNPSVDISYEIDQLLSNKKTRTTQTTYYPGGNGINVARALKELQRPFDCYNLIGGESGHLLVRLLGKDFEENHHYFRVDGETRLNAILQEKNPPAQYEIDSIGPEIPLDISKKLLDTFISASKNTIAVLTGSIPPGIDEKIYQTLTNTLIQQGCKVVVDSNGKELQHVIQSQPYLLRLNRHALEAIVKRRLDETETEDVAAAAREIQRQGAHNVCITLGQQGAILVNQDNSLFCNAPKIHIKSTVGSGDSTIAGMISALYQNKTAEEILRFGVICGSATASHPGTELFDLSEVKKEYDDIEVITLDI